MSMLFYDKFTFLNVEANPPWIMILLFYPTSIFDFSSEWKSHLLYNIKCVEMKFCTPLHEENVWENASVQSSLFQSNICAASCEQPTSIRALLFLKRVVRLSEIIFCIKFYTLLLLEALLTSENSNDDDDDDDDHSNNNNNNNSNNNNNNIIIIIIKKQVFGQE